MNSNNAFDAKSEIEVIVFLQLKHTKVDNVVAGGLLTQPNSYLTNLSGYHADTPITIKAEAIHEADSRIH